MHWLRNTVIALAVLLAIAVVWLGIRESGSDLPVNTRLGGDAVLVDQTGAAFDTAALRGKVILLFFGYTHCPDICPAALARISQAWKMLAEEGEGDNVQVVFVTFDPQRDTPEHLREYLGFFDEHIIGLTGTEQQIREFAEKYGVVFMEDEAVREEGPILFTHSDFIYLLDEEGRVRKLFPSDANIDEIVNDAKSLL